MAMGKTPGDPEGNGEDVGFAEINITPLTDIFLVLLIIFMVTSSVIVQQAPGGAQTGLKVNLPQDDLALEGESTTWLVDFDVAESFGQEAGGSGQWVMSPVITGTAVESDPE